MGSPVIFSGKYAKVLNSGGFKFQDGHVDIFGSGSPEGVVTAPTGSTYKNTDDPAELWLKKTGTGNTGWVRLITDSGEINPPDNILIIRSDEDEVDGKQYQTIDNAIAYINGLVTPPSASNRWGIVAGGYQNITQPIPNWTGIIGEENLILYGMIDTMAAEDPTSWEVSGQIYICNARLNNLDLSATNYLYLKDCFVNYATPTGGSLYAVNTSFNSEVVITNINLSGLTSFIATNCALGQGIYPNASSSFVLIYKSVLNYYGWVGEFNGGTFDDCTIEGSPIGNPVFNANIYDFRNGNIVWSSNLNFTIKNGETWTIQGTPCFFLNPIYGFDVLSGGTLNTRGMPMGTAPVTVQVGGTWNNTLDKYDNRASGLSSTETQGAIDELASVAFGFKFTDYVFVSKNSTLALENGSIQAPFKTIQAAINYFGIPTSAADYQRRCMINVMDSGIYTENLVVPHRALTILGSGLTINGTITREIDDNLEFGISSSVFRARFSLIGLGTSARDSHTGFVNGIRVTGNYTETLRSGGVGNTTHDTYFENVRLDGILGGTAGLGQNASYWYGCRFTNNITDTNIYLQRGYNTRIDGTMAVGQIVNLEGMEFNNTTLSCLTSIAVEQGWRDCSFLAATTFTINAAQTIAVDSQTDKSILANVTFTNAPTKVYLEGSSSIQNQSTVSGVTVTNALDTLAASVVAAGKYLVTVGAAGADYTTLNAAIDAVALKGGGIIKIIDDIHNYASGGLAKNVSNITFMGKNATVSGGSVLFWNSGAGAWTGDNVSFVNLSLRARPGSSGNLLTASATGKYYFRDCPFVGIDGSTSPSLATSILNCNSQECYIFMHNTQMQGPAAPGNRNIVTNCGSSTVWMTGRSRWNGTACSQMYRDAGSILAGTAPTTDTRFDDHNVLTNLQLAAAGVTYGHVNDQPQTIAGIKSFSSFPVTPSAAPISDYEVANKKYVDDQIALLPTPMIFKGAIALNSDFPTLGDVQVGWLYTITADVTDNDPTKTNTGASFVTGDEIVWDGSAWVVMGRQTAFANQQIIYVGKHGNDLYSGLNIENAVLTFAQAMIIANTMTPGANNPVTIVCLDSGIYQENITFIAEYVHVFAPNAVVESTGVLPTVQMVTNTSLDIGEVRCYTNNVGILLNGGTGGTAIAKTKRIIGADQSRGVSNLTMNGILIIHADQIYVDNNGYGIGDINSTQYDIKAYIGEIILRNGMATAFSTSTMGGGGTIDAYVNTIEDDGTASSIAFYVPSDRINATVKKINVDNVYNVVNGVLALTVDQMSGTQINGNVVKLINLNGGSTGQVIKTLDASGNIDWSDEVKTIFITQINNALSPYTPTTTDNLLIVDCSAGNVVIDLPSIAASIDGDNWQVKRIDNTLNTLTIQANSGGDSIDGVSSFNIGAQYNTYKFVADKTSNSYWVIS